MYQIGCGMSAEQLDRGSSLVSGDRKCIILYVLACVSYSFPSDPGRYHQTQFGFRLERADYQPLYRDDTAVRPEAFGVLDRYRFHIFRRLGK